jgi:hypothetical protein
MNEPSKALDIILIHAFSRIKAPGFAQYRTGRNL